MSEEINKIIDNLEGCIGMFDYLITPVESNLLVSYIKELQQEAEKLQHYKTLYQSLKKQKEELRSWLKDEIINSKAVSSQYYFFGRVLSMLEELEGVSNE